MLIISDYFDAIRRYVDFDGRSTCLQYWVFVLVCYGGTILLMFSFDSGWPIGIFVAFHFLPLLAVSVRRLHDFNASGGWLWLHLLFGTFVVIGIGCFPSSEGDNNYGPPARAARQREIPKVFE